MEIHLLVGWKEKSLAKSDRQIHQALKRQWGREHRNVGRGKDAEFCKLSQKRSERRNGKQDSAAN